MNRLTEEEIEKHIRVENRYTGVDAITKEDLEKIDLDAVPEVILDYDIITDHEGKRLYKKDHFTPRAGTIYLKPSFAGRQVLMGRTGRRLHFSNGVWFV